MRLPATGSIARNRIWRARLLLANMACRPRLQKRIADLEAFDPSSVDRGGPEVTALRASIEQTLRDVFGPNTHEFYQYMSEPVIGAPRTPYKRVTNGNRHAAKKGCLQHYAEEKARFSTRSMSVGIAA